MPSGLGNSIFQLLIAIPAIHRFINRRVVSTYADAGPLPGLYTSKGGQEGIPSGKTGLWELLHKENFALEVPAMDADEQAKLPPMDDVVELLRRDGPGQQSRVSLLLPLFAQHLTDAVFQSDNAYSTDAPHEIILNQIYGNTAADTAMLRSGEDGKLRTQTRQINDRDAEFPDALLEKAGDGWRVRPCYAGLSYMQKPGKAEEIIDRYKGREQDVCATGLFQGNLSTGNFAITTLLVREHNRLCDGVLEELKRKGKPHDDDTVFRIAQQINITAYMKVVIEDYINTFAGQKLFMLDTTSFFHEAKRWCRETPIPYHFNTLYRIHCMMPDELKGFEGKGFQPMLANNDLVMNLGVGAVIEAASKTPAGRVSLGNTHEALLMADRRGFEKARRVLGSFNAHRRTQGRAPATWKDFDPTYRNRLKELYGGNINRVEYAVGILAELPEDGWLEKLGLKDSSILGSTLMNAIAKHAFRHILSNRFLTREYLNREVLTDFGWKSLHATSTVGDLVRRNVGGEMDQAEADALKITFDSGLGG